MSATLKFDFQKKKIITFFRRKVSKLHQKKPKQNKTKNNFACK